MQTLQTPSKRQQVRLSLSPEQVDQLNQLSKLAKSGWNEFFYRLLACAWRDAMKCGLVQEVKDVQKTA